MPRNDPKDKPNDSEGPGSGEGGGPRKRILVSISDEAIEVLERLVRERGLGTNSSAVEFMLINFGPWVLSADFITVLADTVRNNRLGGSESDPNQ